MIEPQKTPVASVQFKGKAKTSQLGAILTVLMPIKMILVIPHLVVMFFLGIGMTFMLFIGILAVLFTGKYPKFFAEFIINTYQYFWRVQTYMFNMSDQYPPFNFDKKAHPATINFHYQENVSRLSAVSALLVVRMFMVLPHAIISGILGYAAFALGYLGALINIFTGEYPSFCKKVLMISMNYVLKIYTYFYCLTDKWPTIDFEFEAFEEKKA